MRIALEFAGQEQTTARRCDAEDVEGVAVHHGEAFEPLRLARAGQGHLAAEQGRHVREDLLPRLEIRVVGGREPLSVDAGGRRRLPQHHDPIRLREGERSQEHGMDQAEHGRVRADAEAQREHGDQREARVLDEHPHAVAQVVQDHPHEVASSRQLW